MDVIYIVLLAAIIGILIGVVLTLISMSRSCHGTAKCSHCKKDATFCLTGFYNDHPRISGFVTGAILIVTLTTMLG